METFLIKKKIFIIFFVVLFVGLVFLIFPKFSNKIVNFTYTVFTPIQTCFQKTTKQIKTSWDFLNQLKKIQKDNYILKQKIERLIAENVRLKELEKENQLLRSYLDLPENQRFPVVLAEVAGKDFLGTEKYILLNKGKVDGMKKNFPVIVYNNILIGKITEVFDNFSKAILVSSPNCKVPVLIQETRTEGLLEGETTENELILNLVPKDKKIETGQMVITSGIDGVYPKGLLIGEVSKVEVPEKEMFQKIKVKPAIEIKKLERVLIITGPKQENE